MAYERLRNLREDRDLTQKEVGDYLKMSQTGYSQYELGNNDVPTRILRQLALFYDTSVDYLLDMTDETRPYPRKHDPVKKQKV